MGYEPILHQGRPKHWPTPRAEDAEWAGNHPNATDSLVGTTRLWPTATAKDAASSGTRKDASNFTLTDRAVRQPLWTTPTQDDAGGRTTRYAQGGPALGVQTGHWASPVARDYRSAHENDRNGSLPIQATGHPTEAMKANGRVSLNPLFVEWLMGWPRGWTDSGSPVTGWSRWLRQSRSYAFAIA
jgi:hypothetical protein